MSISASAHQILMTYLPKYFKEHDFKSMESTVHLLEKFSSIFFLSVIIFVYLNGKLMFQLFLPTYLPSIDLLYVLIFIPYLEGINRPYSVLFIPGKKQKAHSNYGIVKVTISILLIIFLIPKELFSVQMIGLGAMGLAFIMTLPYLVDLVFNRWYVSKKIGINYSNSILIHFVLGLGAFFLTSFITELYLNLFISDIFLLVCIKSGLFIGIFLFGLVVCKEIRREDVQLFKNLLKPSSYKNSLKDEISSSRKD